MSITAERKEALIKEHARGKGDTGSPEVQVAILTERINNLTQHFKTPREGQPFAPRPADAGQPAPLAARLSSSQGRAALHRSDRQARPSEITEKGARCGAASHIGQSRNSAGRTRGTTERPEPLAGRLART